MILNIIYKIDDPFKNIVASLLKILNNFSEKVLVENIEEMWELGLNYDDVDQVKQFLTKKV